MRVLKHDDEITKKFLLECKLLDIDPYIFKFSAGNLTVKSIIPLKGLPLSTIKYFKGTNKISFINTILINFDFSHFTELNSLSMKFYDGDYDYFDITHLKDFKIFDYGNIKKLSISKYHEVNMNLKAYIATSETGNGSIKEIKISNIDINQFNFNSFPHIEKLDVEYSPFLSNYWRDTKELEHTFDIINYGTIRILSISMDHRYEDYETLSLKTICAKERNGNNSVEELNLKNVKLKNINFQVFFNLSCLNLINFGPEQGTLKIDNLIIQMTRGWFPQNNLPDTLLTAKILEISHGNFYPVNQPKFDFSKFKSLREVVFTTWISCEEFFGYILPDSIEKIKFNGKLFEYDIRTIEFEDDWEYEYHDASTFEVPEMNKLHQLKELDNPNWLLSSIDFKNMPRLKILKVGLNQELLDLFSCNGIEIIEIYNCFGLKSLIIPPNSLLHSLVIFYSPNLQNLDLANAPNLEKIKFNLLGLKELNVSKFTKLKDLKIIYCNDLLHLITSQNTKLETLEIKDCMKLKDLKTNNNPSLQSLELNNFYELETLQISKNMNLERLKIIGCEKLKSLDISDNPALKILILENLSLEEIDFSLLPKLIQLELTEVKFQQVSLEYNNLLETLVISGDIKNKLILPKSKDMTKLTIVNRNPITISVDWDYYASLKSLTLGGINMDDLQFDNFTSLKDIFLILIGGENIEIQNLKLLELIKIHRINNNRILLKNLPVVEKILLSCDNDESNGSCNLVLENIRTDRLFMQYMKIRDLNIKCDKMKLYLDLTECHIERLSISNRINNLIFFTSKNNHIRSLKVSTQSELLQLHLKKENRYFVIQGLNVLDSPKLTKIRIKGNKKQYNHFIIGIIKQMEDTVMDIQIKNKYIRKPEILKINKHGDPINLKENEWALFLYNLPFKTLNSITHRSTSKDTYELMKKKYIEDSFLEFNLTLPVDDIRDLKSLRVFKSEKYYGSSYNNDYIPKIPLLPPCIQELDCSNSEITFLGDLSQSLMKLNCSSNKISEIPDLKNLTTLICSDNQITTFGRMPKLEKLYCANNNLKKLPNLPSLKKIICNDNKIDNIGEFIKLEKIDISNNLLNSPPKLNSNVVIKATNNPYRLDTHNMENKSKNAFNYIKILNPDADTNHLKEIISNQTKLDLNKLKSNYFLINLLPQSETIEEIVIEPYLFDSISKAQTDLCFSSLLPSLEKLNVLNTGDTGFIETYFSKNKITEIKIKFVNKWNRMGKVNFQIFKELDKLHIIKQNKIDLFYDLNGLANLISLTIENINPGTDKDKEFTMSNMKTIKDRCPNLKKLKLKNMLVNEEIKSLLKVENQMEYDLSEII